MAQPKARSPRSGARSRKNPQTTAQRLVRVEELTERIQARQRDVDELATERGQVIRQLRNEGVTFAAIAKAAGISPQAVNKLLAKHAAAQV